MQHSSINTYRYLYLSTREHPKVIRLRIRMRDLIDPAVLENSVERTMRRYPYFCVSLQREGSAYSYAQNNKPVVIRHSLTGVALNSPEANDHMIAFSWFDNWIILDVFHGLTDGTGAYEVVRTLLYYYCSERYGIRLEGQGIRLAGDVISAQEWEDPLALVRDLPSQPRKPAPEALNLVRRGKLEHDRTQTVYSIAIPETEFMRFTTDHDGSPGTMVALFFSRSVARLFPDCRDVIRISLCVNQRGALSAPLAHQCLVGSALLEYKDQMRAWPLERQATAFRGMVFLQTQPERILAGAAGQKELARRFAAAASDTARLALARAIAENAPRVQTATVSYVGKANYREAEGYIRDFRTWTCAETPVLIEVAAVNERFVVDVIQHFASPVYVNAFLSELDQNGITFDLQDVQRLALPTVQLPWTERRD